MQQYREVGDRSEDAKKAFEWAQQSIDLLCKLQSVLSETIEHWDRFNSCDGDIGYFSDIDCSPDARKRRNCVGSLAAIKGTFEVLKNIQRKLVVLEKLCQNSAQSATQSVSWSHFLLSTLPLYLGE
jgi:hypothetical protein